MLPGAAKRSPDDIPVLATGDHCKGPICLHCDVDTNNDSDSDGGGGTDITVGGAASSPLRGSPQTAKFCGRCNTRWSLPMAGGPVLGGGSGAPRVGVVGRICGLHTQQGRAALGVGGPLSMRPTPTARRETSRHWQTLQSPQSGPCTRGGAGPAPAFGLLC